jgi:uncharacterized protein YjbI with pentapeptide repeats
MILAVIAACISGGLKLVDTRNNTLDTLRNFSDFATIISGLASAFGIFDRQFFEKRHLINQIRNQVPDEAKSAISQLNALGLLRDGSLKGADLQGARLAGVDLKATDKKGAHVAANLEKVNFKQANLSGADMRGINLKGANLERVNLENAWLMDADLRGVRFVISNLCGTKLLGANIAGATFVGEFCDGNTILPNGEKWTEATDWTSFGAIDELPEFARPQVVSLEQSEKTKQISEAHHRADLRLLDELWRCITSRHVRQVVDSVSYRNLSNEYFTSTFQKYLYLREEHPEKHFTNPQLEVTFTDFDKVIRAFCDQLINEETVETIGDERIFVPAYKRPEIFGTSQTEKEYYHNLEEHKKTKRMGLDVLKQHEKLVKSVQQIMPEFYFSDDTLSNSSNNDPKI